MFSLRKMLKYLLLCMSSCLAVRTSTLNLQLIRTMMSRGRPKEACMPIIIYLWNLHSASFPSSSDALYTTLCVPAPIRCPGILEAITWVILTLSLKMGSSQNTCRFTWPSS